MKNSLQSCSKNGGHALSIVYALIVVFAFNNYISIAFHLSFGLGRISYVLIDVILLILLIRPNISLLKEHLPIYLFCLFLLFNSLILFLSSGISLESFYSQFSFFRRIALPFTIYIYFVQKLRKAENFTALNEFLYKWFLFVVVLHSVDFIIMNTVPVYATLITNYYNSVEEIITESTTVTTHIPLFGYQPTRCFGIGLNYHSSGLYVLMLYAFNIKMKNGIPIWAHFLAVIAILSNGSIQNLGLGFLLLILCINQVYRHKTFTLVLVSFLFLLLAKQFPDKSFPVVGTVYMLKYIFLVFETVRDYFSDNIYNVIFGIGGRGGSGDLLELGSGFFDVGDIGLIRLLLEGGLIALLLYFVLIIWLFKKYVSPYKGKEPLPIAASVTSIIIGLGSLVHYPVLFSRNNVVLYMLFLAIIVTEKRRDRVKRMRNGQMLRTEEFSVDPHPPVFGLRTLPLG